MASTTRGEYGWQYGHTVLECNRYMLDNEIATDVCFKVGPPDGVTVSIRAHKYMLVSRSAVFEAMFFSGMLETKLESEAVIRIEDIELKTFREFLRFIYCDSAEVAEASVFSLLNAGKKYMLPKLVDLCLGYLEKGLQSENVCSILHQSLLLDESKLTEQCLDLIADNSSEVLKPEILQNASRQTMEAILKLDSLKEYETVIYDACLAWTKAQLKTQKSIDDPSDQQIREMIGDLIYDIRFPAMDAKVFAELVESSTVLSYEEQSTILCYIINQHKRGGMRFNSKPRLGKDRCVDRLGISVTGWNSGPDAIDVKTNRNILVTGLGLFPESDVNGSGYTVDVEILKGTLSVLQMTTVVPFTGNATPYKVKFEAPVGPLLMEAGILYTLVAGSCIRKKLYRRESCQPIHNADNVTFIFSETTCRPNNSTMPFQGQIPQIYFRIPR